MLQSKNFNFKLIYFILRNSDLIHIILLKNKIEHQEFNITYLYILYKN